MGNAATASRVRRQSLITSPAHRGCDVHPASLVASYRENRFAVTLENLVRNHGLRLKYGLGKLKLYTETNRFGLNVQRLRCIGRPTMGILIRKVHAAAVSTAVVAGLFWAGPAGAGILVGTFVESEVETIAKINILIDEYNDEFTALLPNVQQLVDKIEGMETADFTEGILSLSDFDFFQRDETSPTVNHMIFDTSVGFVASSLGSSGFDPIDNAVLGFEQLSGFAFDYYVSKNGMDGWSLWTKMDGFNPVYTDVGTSGSNSHDGTGFTRGDVGVNTLAFDPINGGVSHISMYTSSADVIVPEPSSIVLFATTAACLVGFGWRRKRHQETAA